MFAYKQAGIYLLTMETLEQCMKSIQSWLYTKTTIKRGWEYKFALYFAENFRENFFTLKCEQKHMLPFTKLTITYSKSITEALVK